MKIVEIILEIIGWFIIAIGTTLGVGLIALIAYYILPDKTDSIAAITIISTGFILGAIWATRIWKKHGTIAWLSQIRKIS